MKQHEAFLARDIIQMIREYKDDANVLEYLESFSVSIARMVEDTSSAVWNDIASICDQRYYSLKQGNPIEINVELLDQCERSVDKFL
jgi:hypothetical protein